MASLALYIHVPFCRARCGYCDFFSVTEAGPHTVKRLVDGLIAELQARRRAMPDGPTTVFLGGGTPTVLPDPDLVRLLHAALAGERLPNEITVEANPESLSPDKCDTLVGCGVNRLSIGAQTFDAGELRFLERVHDVPAIETAVCRARQAGIRNLSLDLMFGIPGQTRESWTWSLKRAVELEVDHLSCYGLTYESGTRLSQALQAGEVSRCDEELEAALYLQAIDTLTAAGYEHYEISNFARPGRACRHNLAYWRNEPSIGIGPSAAGYVDGRRYRNVADLDAYIGRIEQTGLAEETSETLTGTELAGELIMLGLRMREGLAMSELRNRSGVDVRTICAGTIAGLENRSLLRVCGDRLLLTRQGMLVADAVITDLMASLDDRHR